MKASSFCRYLSNQIKLQFDQVMPCCWIHKQFHFDDLDQYKHWVDTNNNWMGVCGYCLDLERKNIRSPRTMANSTPWQKLKAHQDEANHITSVEIQIDNECNGACIMCGEWSSSTWAKFNLTNSTTIPIKSARDMVIQNTRENTRLRLSKILTKLDFTHLRQIIFLGGEPFINHSHIDVLDAIGHQVPVESLSLRYITNASQVWLPEHIDIMRRAKQISMVFSVDALGSQFNYHRWPLQWHQVENNIRKFFHLGLTNVVVGFSITLTPLNIYYYNQVENWLLALAREFPACIRIEGRDAFSHSASGMFSTASVPLALRQMLRQKYGENHQIYRMLQPYNGSQYKEFMSFIEDQDQKRGLNWREVFSDVEHCFPKVQDLPQNLP